MQFKEQILLLQRRTQKFNDEDFKVDAPKEKIENELRKAQVIFALC